MIICSNLMLFLPGLTTNHKTITKNETKEITQITNFMYVRILLCIHLVVASSFKNETM